MYAYSVRTALAGLGLILLGVAIFLVDYALGQPTAFYVLDAIFWYGPFIIAGIALVVVSFWKVDEKTQ